MATLSDEARNSYYDYARRGQLFSAYAIVTAPVIFTTAAGTGGPLLWNNTASSDKQVNAVLLAVGLGITTASAAASSIGITGGVQGTTAPTSTTAIDAKGNCLVGGPAPRCNVYRVGTVANAGSFFQPLIALGTGALTVDNIDLAWTDIHGMIVVPPGNWASVAASATATSAVMPIGLLWAEVTI